jgi:hypothetical protein
VIRRAIGAFALLASASAAADITPPTGEVDFDLPLLWNHFEARPYGFSPNTLAAPVHLGAVFDPLVGFGKHFRLWFEPGLYFYRANFAPVVSVAQGVGWNFTRFHLEVGFELVDQVLLQNGPIAHSQYDAVYFELQSTQTSALASRPRVVATYNCVSVGAAEKTRVYYLGTLSGRGN